LLSDFGIAKQVKIDVELTSTGTVLGSPFYMSPEQAEGDEVDGRSDIYSLGVIFYEMLMGCRPYVGESAIKIILHHIQAPIPLLPKDLSRFQPLLNRMMAKEPKDRLPDAATLVKEVADLRQSVSETSKRPTRVDVSPSSASERPVDNEVVPEAIAGVPVQHLYRSNRTLWMLFAGLALLAVVCLGFYLYTESLTKSAIFTRPHAPEHGDRVERGDDTEFSPSVAEYPVQSPASVSVKRDILAGTAFPLNGGAPVREDVLKALSWLAQHSLREGRLTIPTGDNANYYFQRILALDPDNAIALKGLSDIAERYVVLAEKQFAQKHYQQARTYIEEGLQQQADNQGLLTLQSIIEKREKSMVEKLVEFLRGES
jgi:serine/threonine-protein kinase PpkA